MAANPQIIMPGQVGLSTPKPKVNPKQQGFSRFHEIYTKEERALLDRVKQYVDCGWKHAIKKFGERKKYYQMYLNKDPELEKAKLEWQSYSKHPFPHSSVQQKVALFATALLGNESQGLFRVNDRNNLHRSEAAMGWDRVLQYQMSRTKPAHLFTLAMLDMVVTGDAYQLARWKKDWVPRYDDPVDKIIVTPDGEFDTIKVYNDPRIEVIFDQPWIENIHPNNVWEDPSGTDVQFDDHRFVVTRHLMPYSQAKHMEELGVWQNIDYAKDQGLPKSRRSADIASSFAHLTDYEIDYYTNIYAKGQVDDEDPIMEILHCWVPGAVVTLGNMELISPARSPFSRGKYPLVHYSNNPLPGRFNGLSDFYVNQYQIKNVNVLNALMQDNYRHHVSGMIFADGSLDDEAVALIESGEPNRVIQVGSVDGIRIVRPDLPDAQVVGAMNAMINDTKENMSISELLSGGSPGSEFRTTGSLELLAQVGQLRTALQTQRLAEQVQELGLHMLALNRTENRDFEMARIGGRFSEDMVVLDPRDIPLDIDLEVKLASIADVATAKKVQSMLQFHNQMINIPTFDSQASGIEIASHIPEYEDAMKLFITDPEERNRREYLSALAGNSGQQKTYLAGAFAPQPVSNLPQGQPDPNQVAAGNIQAGTANVPQA